MRREVGERGLVQQCGAHHAVLSQVVDDPVHELDLIRAQVLAVEEPGNAGDLTPERGLAEYGAEPRGRNRQRRVRMVLNVDDLAVLQLQDVRPAVAVSMLVGPGDGDDDPIAPLLDRVEAAVVIT